VTQLPIAGIGRRVAEYRKRNNWSAQRLADNTDGVVSRSTIANLESGRRRDLGLQQFLALCLALRVPPVALLVDLHDPLTASQVIFPGTAPAPLEPSAPQAALARWLDGDWPDTSTAAARHVHSLLSLLTAYLDTENDVELDAVRERLSNAAPSPVVSGARLARHAELATLLQAAGVRLTGADQAGSDDAR
jgi:transcriptional regulator with XRE-family HTH domain